MRRAMMISCFLLALGIGYVTAADSRNASSLVGTWEGTLKVGAVTLRMVFNVSQKDGALVATMDSPDQGVRGIPVSAVALADAVATFEVKKISGVYQGTLSADGSRLEGGWKQGGRTFPLSLQKAVAGQAPSQAEAPSQSAPALGKAEEPSVPFPYEAIEVSFDNPKAGVQLSGTLTLPKGSGPFPALVLVTGSGPQNRDEEILGHKPFLVIADYLTRRGIAVLRYDDRGVGRSGGVFSSATTFDFSDDALAAVAFLAARPKIDAGKIGVVGHSEGAIVAAIAASRSAAVSFIVMLAGPGVRGDQLLLMQGEAIAKASGASMATIAEAKSINAELYAIAMRQGSAAELKAEIVKVLKERATGMKGASDGAEDTEAGNVADQLLSPWMRSFLALDPSRYLASVKIPVLAMNGSKDVQVPAEANLSAIGAALKMAGNDRFKLLELDGLNHLFQHATTGLPDEYGSIAETFAPEALSALGDWIEATTR